ncbi:MAG: hypothetical protein AAGC93_06970 [Cyanobacteria bacterium P01_F01_bin.53]
MKATRLLSATAMAWGALASSVLSMPEIASGDGIVYADTADCLARTDDFISTLDVSLEYGQIDRTGYFGDGSFRILCYPNPYGDNTQSLVVIFAAHEHDFDVADTFVQIAVGQIADQ